MVTELVREWEGWELRPPDSPSNRGEISQAVQGELWAVGCGPVSTGQGITAKGCLLVWGPFHL